MNRLAKIMLISAMLYARPAGAADEPFTTLHVFTLSMPNFVAASDATLYGTSRGIGTTSDLLFKMNTDGGNYAVLKTFQYQVNDGRDVRDVIVAGTILYGTTFSGGGYGAGVVYKINTDGTGYTLLHEFDGANGRSPQGPLMLAESQLFGTTLEGGSWDDGTIFKVNTDGTGFTVLKEFTGNFRDPSGGLVLSGSKLYGHVDHYPDLSVIFTINTDGSGYTDLKQLSPAEGRGVLTPLIVSGTTIYGAAHVGGVAENGNIFRMNTDGTGFTVLKAFDGTDGANPGSLTLSGTHLFGTTIQGGSDNIGVVFALKVDGSGFTILRHFTFHPWHGDWPVVSAVSGLTLFGTTYDFNPGVYCGEVFSLTVSPPVFAADPQSQTAEAGSTVSFSASANAFPQPVYNWRFNETNSLASGSNSVLLLTNVKPSQSGAYTVIVTNLFGAVTSAPALLNVIAPVARRWVPGVNLLGQSGNFLGLDYRNNFGPAANWQTMATLTLSNASQFYFDLTEPLPPQRFYRAWQSGVPGVVPSLDLHMVPAITLTGDLGSKVRVDGINQFGPTDAWFTLATVTLTNPSQLYFDVSCLGQPARLYRLVPMP